MSHVLWIRHGATDWNLTGRYLGGTDISLNDTGRAEFQRLVEAYRAQPVRRIYSSPFQRALESAKVLQQAWDCELVVDERLKELHFGAWEGLTTPEIQQKFPKLWQEWLACKAHGPFPGGGESFAVFHRRVGDFIKERCDHVAEPLAVVAHGGVLRSSLVQLLRLPLSYYWAFQFGRASVTRTRHDGPRVVVEYVNRCFSDEARTGVDEHA